MIILFEAVKQYQSVIVSCADFVQGQSYSIYSRPATGSDNGTLIGTVKISSIITTVGNSSGGMGPGGMGPGSRPGRW